MTERRPTEIRIKLSEQEGDRSVTVTFLAGETVLDTTQHTTIRAAVNWLRRGFMNAASAPRACERLTESAPVWITPKGGDSE